MASFENEYGLLKHDLEWRAHRLRETIKEQGRVSTLETAAGDEITIKENISYLEETDTEVAFFTIANELIKILETELFEIVFIESQFRDGTIPGQLGRKSMWSVFNRFNIINDELDNMIGSTIDLRNALVHEVGRTQRKTSIEDLEKGIKDAMDAVEGLEAEIRDRTSGENRPEFL